MARPVSWLQRAPAILHAVTISKRPRYGALDIQNLFTLQPRRAQELMKMLPRIEVGMALQVSREDLLAFLERVLAAAPPGCGHHAAGEAITGIFTQILAAGAPVTREQPATPVWPVRLTPRSRSLASLPESILVSRGHVHISGRTREEVAEALLALSEVIEGDEFAARFELSKPVQRADPAALEVRGMFAELEQMEAAHAQAHAAA